MKTNQNIFHYNMIDLPCGMQLTNKIEHSLWSANKAYRKFADEFASHGQSNSFRINILANVVPMLMAQVLEEPDE